MSFVSLLICLGEVDLPLSSELIGLPGGAACRGVIEGAAAKAAISSGISFVKSTTARSVATSLFPFSPLLSRG